MAPHLAASGAARRRFIREAQAVAAIVHPHVMPIHSVCTSGRLPYLAMPFVACESLQQRIDREGPLKLEEILRIGIQTASGLAAAHAQGLVHRDVNPANILLEKGIDRALLTDFGLARAADDGSLTRTGVVAGTPRYMSPEQAQGEPVDARSDLFSLGSVLYAMATGRPPFRAETALGILRRICDSEPRPIREVNAEIPDWLATIVEKMHKKAPGDRLQTAGEVAALLEQCLAHVQQPTVSPLPESLRGVKTQSPHRRPSRRGWRSVALTSVAVACGAVFATLAAIGAWKLLKAPANTARGPDMHADSPALETLSDAAVTREANALRSDLERLEVRAREMLEPLPPANERSPSTPNEEPLP
jgi:serine/threonine-protein kinase